MDEAALLGLSSHVADAQAQQRAAQYFEQLKSSPEGWRLCASALSMGTHLGNDHVNFFCLQVVENHLKTKYLDASPVELQDMKSFLLTLAQMQCCAGVKKTFIRNKIAQLFSLACVADYPNRWPSFFSDLLQLLQLGDVAMDLYLRVMMAIDSEVVDREIVHTDQEIERNTMIKDAMRVQCVSQLVDSWYHILATYENSNPELTCFCMDVIGNYVSWIEITLIANDKFVAVLLRFLSNNLLRESTCDCIHEIISKGMEPVAKAKLIESFMVVLNQAGILHLSEDEEGDFLAKLSKLVNGIGLQLILGWQKLYKSKDIEGAKVILDYLEAKIPLMFHLLGHEDDDVSGAVSQYAHDYITLLKQIAPLTESQQGNVKDLLYVVIKKMKYDDSYNFQNEGEDEAMFQEYRKQLKIILNNVGVLDAQLVLNLVRELLTRTLEQWQTRPYQEVEVAITLLYMLAEALPASHGQHFSGDAAKVGTLQELMRLLVNSQVSHYQHSAVAMQFFETVVRYDKFFNQEPQFIPDVLMAFLDERGLRNSSPHVRSRTAYLFSRFVKSLTKSHLHGYLEDIMARIQDLLVLNSPDNGLKTYLTGDDQLFVYETASVLVVHSQFPPQKKQVLMKQLLAPVVSKFDDLLQGLALASDEKQQQAYVECLTQAMAFASRSSKGFTSQQTMKQCGCVEAYTETLRTFLSALAAPVQRGPLHAGVRQFLHRMVVCLDAEVLPFIPVAVERLLQQADAREMHDFIPLLNQVISKFKTHVVPFLQEVFMPVVTTIFQVLNAPVDERDQIAAAEKKMLQRGYFSFLATIVNNNVTEVLSSQDPEHLQQVLLTLIQGAVDIPDPVAQKCCFSTLRHLVEVWGGKDGLAGFNDFMCNDIVPACFMAPMKPTFDLADAQTVLVLNECSQCLKAMVDKQGGELVHYLQTRYLPTLNIAPEIIQEFLQAVKSEQKLFRIYYKSFFIRAKS